MARCIYDFLNDSVLLDEVTIDEEFKDLSEERLRQELDAYRAHVLAHLQEVRRELHQPTAGPRAVVGSASDPMVSRLILRRMALYFDRAIIDDPLLSLTRRVSPDHQSIAEFIGYESPGPINRVRLAHIAGFLRAVRPMVGYDFLRIAPLGLANEPPSTLGLVYSPTLFSERVPDRLREWMQQRCHVRPLEQRDKGWGFRSDAPLKPCRGIAVEIEGFPHFMVFHLTATGVEAHPHDRSRLTLMHTLPEEPPTREAFDAWVQQSINQFCGNVYERVTNDVLNATGAGGMLLTDSTLIADMLSLGMEGESIEADIARLVLDLTLPGVDEASEESLMRVRTGHGEAFERFRIDMERGLLELSNERDYRSQRRMLDKLRHELGDLRVREMRAQLSRLRRGLLGDAALGVVSLCAAIPSGGLTLLGALVAVAKGIKRAEKYKEETEGDAGYFLWKLQGTEAREAGRKRR